MPSEEFMKLLEEAKKKQEAKKKIQQMISTKGTTAKSGSSSQKVLNSTSIEMIPRNVDKLKPKKTSNKANTTKDPVQTAKNNLQKMIGETKNVSKTYEPAETGTKNKWYDKTFKKSRDSKNDSLEKRLIKNNNQPLFTPQKIKEDASNTAIKKAFEIATDDNRLKLYAEAKKDPFEFLYTYDSDYKESVDRAGRVRNKTNKLLNDKSITDLHIISTRADLEKKITALEKVGITNNELYKNIKEEYEAYDNAYKKKFPNSGSYDLKAGDNRNALQKVGGYIKNDLENDIRAFAKGVAEPIADPIERGLYEINHAMGVKDRSLYNNGSRGELLSLKAKQNEGTITEQEAARLEYLYKAEDTEQRQYLGLPIGSNRKDEDWEKVNGMISAGNFASEIIKLWVGGKVFGVLGAGSKLAKTGKLGKTIAGITASTANFATNAAISTYGQGGSPNQIAKETLKGGTMGAVSGILTSVVKFGGTKALNKAGISTDLVFGNQVARIGLNAASNVAGMEGGLVASSKIFGDDVTAEDYISTAIMSLAFTGFDEIKLMTSKNPATGKSTFSSIKDARNAANSQVEILKQRAVGETQRILKEFIKSPTTENYIKLRNQVNEVIKGIDNVLNSNVIGKKEFLTSKGINELKNLKGEYLSFLEASAPNNLTGNTSTSQKTPNGSTGTMLNLPTAESVKKYYESIDLPTKEETTGQKATTRQEVQEVMDSGAETGIEFEKDYKEYPYNMKTVIKDYVNYSNSMIRGFVEKVMSGNATTKDKIFLNNVRDRAVSDIKKILGVDVSGYKVALDGNTVRHIVKRHGLNDIKGEHDDSMSNLSDWEKMQYVLENYDNIEYGGTSTGYTTIKENGQPKLADTVVYSKKINGTYYVVEAVPVTNAKTLRITSAYIGNKNEGAMQPSDVSSPEVTSETQHAHTPSVDNISQSENIVNSNDMQNSVNNPSVLTSQDNRILNTSMTNLINKARENNLDLQTFFKDVEGINAFNMTGNDVNTVEEAFERLFGANIDMDIRQNLNVLKGLTEKYGVTDYESEFYNAMTDEGLNFDGESDIMNQNTDGAEIDKSEFFESAEVGADNKFTDNSENINRIKDLNTAGEQQWTTKRENKFPKDGRSIGNIVYYIRDAFDIPISSGKVEVPDAKGIYKVNAETIRTKISNDLPTISHELGHHLDKKYNLRSLSSIDDLIANCDQDFLNMYKPGERSGEAVAEFIREYLKNTNTAKNMSAQFYNDFLNVIDATDLKSLNIAANYINTYMSSDFSERVQDSIVSSKKTMLEGIKDFAQHPVENTKDAYGKRYTEWVDAFYPQKQVMDYVKEVKGGDIDGGKDAYVLATNSLNSATIANHIVTKGMTDMKGNINIGKSLLESIKDVKSKDLNTFDRYLVLNHALEWIQPNNGKQKRVFADETLEDVDNINNEIAKLEYEHPEFKDAAENIYEYQRNVLKNFVVDAGGMSYKGFERMQELYPKYVPFNRDVNNGNQGKAKRTFANQKVPFKHAKGSGLNIISPLESIIVNTEKMVKFAQRNQVMQIWSEYADTVEGFGKFMEEVAPDMLPHAVDISKKKGELFEYLQEHMNASDYITLTDAIDDILGDRAVGFSPVTNASKRIVSVLKNGETKYYQIHDESFYNSIADMSPQQAWGIHELSAKIMNPMKVLTTQNNPLFAGANVIRDIGTAYKNSIINNPVEFVSRYVSALGGIVTKSDDWQKYQSMGGGHSSDLSASIKDIKNTLRNVKDKRKTQKLLSGILHPIQTVASFNDVIESVPRFMEFKKTLDSGGDTQEAIYRADDITTNFKRGGSKAKHLNSIFMYFNSALQGLDKTVRSFKDASSKERKERIVKYLTSGLIMTAIQVLFNRDDEEEYNNLSAYKKNNFYNFSIGDGYFVSIPKARELALFDSTVERIAEYVFGNKEAFEGFGGYILDTLVLPGLPKSFGVNGVQDVLGDTVVGPFIDIIANRDFKGSPIESYSDETLREDYKTGEIYDENTSKLAVYLGNTKLMKNLEISPKQIDHIINSYTGVIGQTNRALLPNNDENRDITLGLKNRFVSDSNYSTDVLNDVYETRDAAKKEYMLSPNSENYKEYMKSLSLANYVTIANNSIKSLPESEQRDARKSLIDTINNWDFDNGIDYEVGFLLENIMEEYEKENPDATTIAVPNAIKKFSYNGNKYELTAEQYAELQNRYNTEYYESIKDIVINTSLTNDEKYEQISEIRKDVMSSIKESFAKEVLGYTNIKEEFDEYMGNSKSSYQKEFEEYMGITSGSGKNQYQKEFEDYMNGEGVTLQNDTQPTEKSKYQIEFEQYMQSASANLQGSNIGFKNYTVTNYNDGRHKGMDFAVPTGTAVQSTTAGKVIDVLSLKDSYGKYVVIKDDSGNYHYYAHLSGFNCSVGDTVSRGTVIGYSGNTGNSTGPHLHYEVRSGNNYNQQLDPRSFL